MFFCLIAGGENMEGKISIIVPVYKIEYNLLHNLINSIIKQSYKNWELLLIDDGSPDDCGAICDIYKSDKIRVFHKKNGGVSSARNCGLANATGEYITFVDGDDSLKEEYLGYLVQLLRDNNAEISCCCCDYSTKKNKKSVNNEITVLDKNEAIDALCYMHSYYYGNDITSVWGKLYKTSAIKNLRFNEKMSISEDFVFNFNCFNNVSDIVIGSARNYIYKDDSVGLIRGSFNKKKYESLLELIDILHKVETKYYTQFLSRSMNTALILLLMISKSDKGMFENERREIVAFINKYRKSVISNVYARKKVRISLVLTYFGYDFMIYAFKLFQSLQSLIDYGN